MVGWESYDEKAVLRIADIFQKYSKNKTTHRLFLINAILSESVKKNYPHKLIFGHSYVTLKFTF